MILPRLEDLGTGQLGERGSLLHLLRYKDVCSFFIHLFRNGMTTLRKQDSCPRGHQVYTQ